MHIERSQDDLGREALVARSKLFREHPRSPADQAQPLEQPDNFLDPVSEQEWNALSADFRKSGLPEPFDFDFSNEGRVTLADFDAGEVDFDLGFKLEEHFDSRETQKYPEGSTNLDNIIFDPSTIDGVREPAISPPKVERDDENRVDERDFANDISQLDQREPDVPELVEYDPSRHGGFEGAGARPTDENHEGGFRPDEDVFVNNVDHPPPQTQPPDVVGELSPSAPPSPRDETGIREALGSEEDMNRLATEFGKLSRQIQEVLLKNTQWRQEQQRLEYCRRYLSESMDAMMKVIESQISIESQPVSTRNYNLRTRRRMGLEPPLDEREVTDFLIASSQEPAKKSTKPVQRSVDTANDQSIAKKHDLFLRDYTAVQKQANIVTALSDELGNLNYRLGGRLEDSPATSSVASARRTTTAGRKV